MSIGIKVILGSLVGLLVIGATFAGFVIGGPFGAVVAFVGALGIALVFA